MSIALVIFLQILQVTVVSFIVVHLKPFHGNSSVFVCLNRVINDSHRIRRGNPSSKCQLKLIKVFKRRGQSILTFISALGLHILRLFADLNVVCLYLSLLQVCMLECCLKNFEVIELISYVLWFGTDPTQMCGCFKCLMFHQHTILMVMVKTWKCMFSMFNFDSDANPWVFQTRCAFMRPVSAVPRSWPLLYNLHRNKQHQRRSDHLEIANVKYKSSVTW